MVRSPACQVGGCGFESRPFRQFHHMTYQTRRQFGAFLTVLAVLAAAAVFFLWVQRDATRQVTEPNEPPAISEQAVQNGAHAYMEDRLPELLSAWRAQALNYQLNVRGVFDEWWEDGLAKTRAELEKAQGANPPAVHVERMLPEGAWFTWLPLPCGLLLAGLLLLLSGLPMWQSVNRYLETRAKLAKDELDGRLETLARMRELAVNQLGFDQKP